MLPPNSDLQQTTTQDQYLRSVSVPNISPFLSLSITERRTPGEGQLSKMALSDTDALLQRQKIENAGIRYSGYLLKRSNQPYCPSNDFNITAPTSNTSPNQHDSELNITASSDNTSPNQNDSSTDITQKLTKNNNNYALRLAASLLWYLFRLAALFGGYLSDKPSILQNSDTLSPQSTDTKSKTTQSSDTKSKTTQSSFIAPPPDHHDPKDGHIWRAKYIILENGVLYFYRNANVGNSLEAQEERDRTFLFCGDSDSNCTSSSGVTKSSLNDDMKRGESKFEGDHLARSPTPRCYFPTLSTTKDNTRGIDSSYSFDSTNVIWEKRVALDRVGSVLPSEMYFQSFVLLGSDLDDNDPTIAAQNFTRTYPVEKNDSKTYINASSSEDRLILRATSPDDMRNWAFEIHRSLQILLNKIYRNRIGSIGKNSGRFRFEPAEKVKQQVSEQTGNNSKELIRGRSEATTTTATSTTLDGGDVASLVTSQPKVVGKYIPPQRRVGKYVPPHLRKEGAGGQHPITSSSAYIITDKSRLQSGDDNTLHTNVGKSGSESQSSPSHDDDAGAIIGPSKRLGGCADPTLIEGSICDPRYIPKKASVVGNVNSKPYGSFGGSPSSGKGDQADNIQWEVGAVSRCGIIRSSNEDAYLVLNDLLGEPIIRDKSTSVFKSFQSHGIFAIFDGHCGNHTARFAAEKFPSILLEESAGDCFLADEGKLMSDEEKASHLLHNTVTRLDREFCKISMADGRDWDSGATALIAIVIGNTLAVAGLGDSNGVLCCATSCDNNTEKDGWTILNEVKDKKAAYISEPGISPSDGRHVHREVNVKLKEIINPHSPSREDERKRIEDANGWVETDSDKISRVCGDLAVSRALGDREFKAAYNILERRSISGAIMHDGSIAIKWGSEHLSEDNRLFPKPSKDHQFKGDVISSIPEINSFNLGKRNMDEFLLLACDGLWDVMNVTDAARLTRDLLFKRGFTAKASAEHLVERAFTLGSRDNVTVIVVRFYGYGTSR